MNKNVVKAVSIITAGIMVSSIVIGMVYMFIGM
jgi:hypothetical protein